MERIKKVLGFTLIELLVVIASIAILAALLLPALSQAREKEPTCLDNLKLIGTAILLYAQDYDGFPPLLNSKGKYIWQYGHPIGKYFGGTRFCHEPTNYPDCWSVYFCPTIKTWYGANGRLLYSGLGTRGKEPFHRLSEIKYPSDYTMVFCTGNWASTYLKDVQFKHQNNTIANFLFVDGHVEEKKSTSGLLDFIYPYGTEGGAKYWGWW